MQYNQRCSANVMQNGISRGVSKASICCQTLNIIKPRIKNDLKSLASKKHSEAERRRRMRINGQYATLRAILPNLVKKDKASVLEETIRRVTDLRKLVGELKTTNNCGSDYGLPAMSDRVSVEHCDDGIGLLKAKLSCEERPELVCDLARAVRSVQGRVVRAEITTVGERTKWVLWIQGPGATVEVMRMLKQALMGLAGKRSRPPWMTNKQELSLGL